MSAMKSALLRRRADWTMTCPWCKGTAHKQNREDDFKCTSCSWTSKEGEPKAMAQHAAITPKIRWKVSPEPTGRYRSFDRRGWPFAEYADGRSAARIQSEDDYVPSLVREGKHTPLEVYVADYSITPTEEKPAPWKWRRMKSEFATLKEAQEAVVKLLAAHPEILPKPKTEDLKQGAVEIHETPTSLPPRDDMRRHLDKDVQKEIDLGIDKDPQEGTKLGTEVTREEQDVDQIHDMKSEARRAFMEDAEMTQISKETGVSMEDLWSDHGQDYANEYWMFRRSSKKAMKAEEGTVVCPKCNQSNVEEVTDGETEGNGGALRLMECKVCTHLFSL